ncbi:hypothetical protein E2C01_051637 [Portunus trituberculatus]|uniref:Uncharacterized protein n=1 Tax=Portunus trituberculatus TaxID=210409 RepID=A0A5B7GFC4_PORTR|nr:hypothetical protein [Portunus trituberculatus]
MVGVYDLANRSTHAILPSTQPNYRTCALITTRLQSQPESVNASFSSPSLPLTTPPSTLPVFHRFSRSGGWENE